jgi:hypothetical protein
MPNDLMTLVKSVLAQKRALDIKERQLIASLNRVLPDMGYQVVPSVDGGQAGARRRRGRPPGVSARPAGSARKKFVCAQCGRRFGRPLHLGRHTSAMHKASGSKAAAKASPRKARRRKRAPKAARAKAS